MAMLTVLLLLSAAFALGDAGVRGPFFTFIKTARTWAEAQRHCISLGFNLASVHSSDGAQHLKELVFSKTGEFTPTWIGGFEVPKEILEEDRIWFWSDGSTFDYQNWDQGEPNNSGGSEQCIMMNSGGGEGWNDLACGNRLPSVCLGGR